MVVPLDAVWVHGTYGHIVYRSNPVSRSGVYDSKKKVVRCRIESSESNMLLTQFQARDNTILSKSSHDCKRKVRRFCEKGHTSLRKRPCDSKKKVI